MKKIKNYLDETKWITIPLTVMVVFAVLLFKFILKKPFLLNNDQSCQYNLFYQEWIRMIVSFLKGEGLPFYSWNTFLGTDFYSSMTFDCVGDLFLPMLLLLRNHLELALVFETVACLFIAALLFDFYLRKKDVKNCKIRCFLALLYAVGGISMHFLGQYMWLRFLAFFPLIFIGIEDYFKRNKTWIFILAVFIEFLQSYYFMWPTTIFILIYCIYDVFKYKRTNVILKDFITLVFRYIVGVLLSCIILLPTVLYVLGNPRVGNPLTSGLFWDLETYIGLFVNFIVYNATLISPSVFPHTHGVYNYLIGLLPFGFSVAYVLKKNNKEELFTLLVLLALALLKPGSSLMHGFSEAYLRWTFIVEFFFLFIAAKGMEERLEIKKIIIPYLLVVTFILVILVLRYDMINQFSFQLLTFVISILMEILIWILYFKNLQASIMCSVLMVIALLICQVSFETKDATYQVDDLDRNCINCLTQNGEESFRIYVNYDAFSPYSSLNLNQSLNYDYMPTTSYISLYDNTTSRFFELNGFDYYPNWIFNIDNELSWNALGVKYIIADPYAGYDDNGNYEYVTNNGYYKVYENLNYRGFGYTMSNLKHMDENSTVEDLDQYLLIDEDVDLTKYNNLECSELTVNWRTNNSLSGDISLNSDNILCITIPNKEGWKVMVNGAETETISVNGGFMGIELSAGENHIELYYVPPGFKLGAVLTGIGTILFIGIMFLERKKNEI